MSGLPEITIAGTLVADPKLTYLDSGACVANFTIAANDRRFDREQSQWVDGDATFLRCSLWRQEAENITESLRQGDRVLATGVLKQRKYETDAGEKRTVFELAVTELGASLKFATARPSKVRRNAGKSADSDPRSGAAPAATPEPAHSGAASDEPPF